MSALRQRAAHIARQARPAGVRNTRSYASSHGQEHAHNVEEPLGAGFYIAGAAILGSAFVYSISRPAENGDLSPMHKWMIKISDYSKEWETKNQLMSAALEQAAHDKHLLLGAQRSTHYELKYPEVFSTGSPFNVPAGHYANIDKVVAHYQKQHLEDEARKAKKLAAASQ